MNKLSLCVRFCFDFNKIKIESISKRNEIILFDRVCPFIRCNFEWALPNTTAYEKCSTTNVSPLVLYCFQCIYSLAWSHSKRYKIHISIVYSQYVPLTHRWSSFFFLFFFCIISVWSNFKMTTIFQYIYWWSINLVISSCWEISEIIVIVTYSRHYRMMGDIMDRISYWC